jgi:hypothetical protein
MPMGFHSIPEPQESAPSAAVTSASSPDPEIDSRDLWLLREFFLLLDEWDQQGGQP